MDLTPLKRALVSGELPMTYKVHNPRAPQQCADVGLDNTPTQRRKLAGTKRCQPNNPGANLALISRRKTNGLNSTQKSP